jgi:Kef-type K+ transport system membrane component KefB
MTADTYLIASLWLGLALAASLISIRIGVSVALLEIGMGIIGGNLLHFQLGDSTTSVDFLHLHLIASSAWINFLASFGSVVLTFLAGAEIDPALMRAKFKESVGIGFVSFLFPFLGAFAFCLFVVHWKLHAAEIGGIALSTASVAVVYAVMVETGLNKTEFGKIILSAVFVTDLGTVLALGVLFANFNGYLLLFAGVTIPVVLLLPRVTRWYFDMVGERVSEPEIKYVFILLFALGGLATLANSEGVLPAYLIGVAIAGVFLQREELAHRTRSIAFTLLTPFYFIKAGLYVAVSAVIGSIVLIVTLFGVKMVTKVIGVYPMSTIFRFTRRDGAYITAMMSTGLTFGTISALFGLTHHIIDRTQYTVLVTVVIMSAVIPTLIGQAFFRPAQTGDTFTVLRGEAEDEVEELPTFLPSSKTRSELGATRSSPRPSARA